MKTFTKKLKNISLLAALAFAGIAHGALVPQVNFVELSFDELGVPANEADRFTIVPCQGCEAQTVRLTAATVYRIDGHRSAPVTFRDFRDTVRSAEDKDGLLFYVGYAPDTNQVAELVLDAGE